MPCARQTSFSRPLTTKRLGVIAAAALSALATRGASAQQRVLGIDISYWNCGTTTNGLTQSMWNTAYSTPNANGYTRSFVQIRSTRGGTKGLSQTSGTPGNPTQETLSRRYDDSRFLQNITRATIAGLHAGPYHYGRPDIAGNTGTDEANHMIEMAGIFMRPGYMMPMFDLEAGTSANALAQFSIDFSNQIYAVKGIRPSMYINGNHTNYLVGSANQAQLDALAKPLRSDGPTMTGPAYPMLWNARYSDQTSPETIPIQTGEPKTTYTTVSSYYGPWDDYGNAEPWSFWQFASVVSVPGINSVDTTVDSNVSHGDIEYVRNYLVPAVWMNDSSGDWSTLANWNSGEAVVVPTPGAGQADAYAYDASAIPVPRLPGASGSGPTSGQYDTVILERPSSNIAVTLSTGMHNIRKMYMREALNITGGSLTINYDPTYRADNSAEVLHGGPVSAQFSGPVTLSGTGALTAHTVLVDPAQTFSVSGGTYTFNTLNLSNGATGAKLLLAGNATFSPLNGATASINRVVVGLPANAVIDLGGGSRTLTVTNGASAVDLDVNAPIQNGSFTKGGAGTLRLNTAATYAGATGVAAGILRNGVANALPTGTALTVGTGATYDLNGFNQAVGSLSGNGSVQLSGSLTTGSANTITTFNGSLSGTGSLTKTGTGPFTVNGLATYTGATTASSGFIRFGQSLRNTSAVSVAAGATLSMTGRTTGGLKVLQTKSLSIASGGKLDLNDNDLVVGYGTGASPFTTIRNLVFQGYSGSPDPSKTGIISSTGQTAGNTILAVVDNAALGAADWPLGSGQTIAGNSVIGKYTYFGDANLDGAVTPDDYAILDSNLETSPAPAIAWLSGDANLDGSVTSDDYAILDSNLGAGVGNPLSPAGVTPIPEPHALSLLLAGGLLLRRRRGSMSE